MIVSAKRYVILGAGAAGLSLCHALLERGVTDDIRILDRKLAFTDDRTWCFWDTAPHPYSHLVSHCWHSWDVIGSDGRRASQHSGRGYGCLRGIDFYTYVLGEIRRYPNVTLELGSPVECTLPDADFIFDSRPRPVPPGGLTFSQRFFGQFVRAQSPTFDPSRCTLMDFQVSQERGLHFIYVLPFSPTEALVENTYIQSPNTQGITATEHKAEISAYLGTQFGLDMFAAEREESGAIPMTTQEGPRRDGNVFFIGTAGGCSKPSSGYTFTRIQQQCRRIADAAAAGTLGSFEEPPTSARFRFFDTVFLQALSDNPGAFPDYFYRLFSRVSPERLTAFLSETSLWPSDLSIVRSLPLPPFLKAALQAVPLLTRSGPN